MFRSITLAAVMAFAFSSVSFAQVKVGVVDMSRCFLTSTAGVKASEELKSFEGELVVKLKVKETQEELAKLEKDYIDTEKTLTEAGKRAKLEVLQKKSAEIENIRRTYTSELQKKDRELTARIHSEVVSVVEGLAKEGKYTLVIDKQGAVYSADGTDITDKVIELYNKQQTAK
ncbi:MAG: OmpH family outer membrane protein [Deferribacteraceae bacterium]|jgi:Skp family chaperone for outer membrane proteins|nr:OmpH family outer membrane protein [Deferribacteraceae bacterium]